MKRFAALILLCLCQPLLAFQSVVVLPFSNESEKQHVYWLGEGFAETLSEELLLKDVYMIQRPQRLHAYEDLRIPYTGGLSRATMLKIAGKLAADYVIFGSYNLKESNLDVEVKVIKLSSSKLSDNIKASGSLDDLYKLQVQIRDSLLRYFSTQNIAAAQERPFDHESVQLYAYELYIKAMLESSDQQRIDFLQRAIEANPGYPQAILRMGSTLSRMQKYRESSEYLKKATFKGEAQAKADFMIGLNHYLSNEFDEANNQWQELAKTHPTAEVMNNIGLTLVKKNDLQGAGWYLAKAVELSPGHPSYHFNLGASYVLRSHDQHAVLQYRDSIKSNPGDYQAMYLASKLMERDTDPIAKNIASKRMWQLFQATLPADLKSKFPEQYNTVNQLFRPAMKYLTKEEQDYERVAREKYFKDTAGYIKTYQASALSYIEKGEPDKAILEIKKGVGLDPLNWYLHHLWGRAYLQQKNQTAAFEELEFSVWCKDNIESHLLMAELLRQSERYADSKLHIQRTLAIDPNNRTAMEIWGKIWDKQ